MNICFRADSSLAKLLQEQADKEGTNASQIIRQAILVYLTQRKPKGNK